MAGIRFPELADCSGITVPQPNVDKNSLGIMKGLGFMREKFGGRVSRTLLAGMSLTALSLSEGCRADLLPPAIGISFSNGPDSSGDVQGVDGSFIVDSFGINGDVNEADGSVDEEADASEAVDSEVDGSTDEASDVSEIGDSAVDGGTDDATLEIGEEVVDGSEADAIDGGLDNEVDGSTDEVADVNEVVNDAVDGGSDDGSGADTIDGGVDNEVDGSIDDATLEIGGEVVDGSGENVVDGSDIQIPITCDGQSVGTVKVIPTLGPKGEVGICLNGEEVCTDVGAWAITKVPVDPDVEKCNLKDDNCDGFTDEGLLVEKDVSYDPIMKNKGQCVAAVFDCVKGVQSMISPEVGPEGEYCLDKIDNNCNGVTDETPCSCDKNLDGFVDLDSFDPALKDAVIISLGKMPNDKITLVEAENVTTLQLSNQGLTSLSGLECFTNLTTLLAHHNKLTDLSPIKALPLKAVYLHSNLLSDVSVLGKMISLVTLRLDNNDVADISSFVDLINLATLRLDYTLVKDITSLINNVGIGLGDLVSLVGDDVSASQVKALEAKGVTVNVK